MNQTYKATFSQYALPQFLPTWGRKGGVIWEDLEVCSLKTMMFEKYPSISPYTYCANNPMKYVDPTGEKVKPAGNDEVEMIRNTVPEEDRQYIKLDKDGFIDKKLLNSHKSESGNYNKLKELVKTKETIDVIFGEEFTYADQNGVIGIDNLYYAPFDPKFPEDKDLTGETMGGTSTGETGMTGITLLPDRTGERNSPDKNIKIIIHKGLSPAAAAEIYSHEANGHALLYLRNGRNVEGAGHQPVDGKWVEGNLLLKSMIIESKRETIKNMIR